jgi:hypothetical protein
MSAVMLFIEETEQIILGKVPSFFRKGLTDDERAYLAKLLTDAIVDASR